MELRKVAVLAPDASVRERYNLDAAIAAVGWQPIWDHYDIGIIARDVGIAIEFLDSPIAPDDMVTADHKRLVIWIEQAHSHDDTAAIVHAFTSARGYEPTMRVLGPTHVEGPVVEDVVQEFLHSVDAARGDPQTPGELSMLLEGLLAAIERTAELTEELAKRHEEIEQLHEEIEALRVLARSLQRRLNKRRLGSLARLAFDVGVAVLASRLDSALFSDVEAAVRPVVVQCEQIIQQLNLTIEVE